LEFDLLSNAQPNTKIKSMFGFVISKSTILK